MKLDQNEVDRIVSEYNGLHDRVMKLHEGCNCFCDGEADTFTISPEGAGDMEICLECFGARGRVY